MHHTSTPVLHVLEKLSKYWSLLLENHKVNSARIIDPAARIRLNTQEVLKDDLSVEWELRADSAQQISNLSITAACQMSDYVKPVDSLLAKAV